MTNREKYLDAILADYFKCTIALLRGAECETNGITCRKCKEESVAWLQAEYKETECKDFKEKENDKD